MTKESISLTTNIFGLFNVPSNVLIVAGIIFGLFILFSFIFFMIRAVSVRSIKAKKVKKEKANETHEVIRELKEALVKEMKGTTRQNWIMIWLTVIFIAVTVFGGSVFFVLFTKLGQEMMNFAQKILPLIKQLIAR